MTPSAWIWVAAYIAAILAVLWFGHRLELHLHALDRPLHQRGEGNGAGINQSHEEASK